MNSGSMPPKAVAHGAGLSFADSPKISTQQNSVSYRAEIDGLRALAVATLIINHVDSSLLSSGHLGVDISSSFLDSSLPFPYLDTTQYTLVLDCGYFWLIFMAVASSA
jgi:hypothetical protein